MTNRSNQAGTISRPIGLLAAALAVLTALALPSQAADIFKADNLDTLNQATSWDGAVVPTAADIAVWDNRVATAVPHDVLLGADTNWSGIRIADPASAVRLGAGNTLTLGAAGIDTSLATQPLTLSNAVVIGVTQPWNLGSGVIMAASLNSGANSVQKTGAGTLTLAAGVSGTATIQIDSGIVVLNTGGSTLTNALNGGTVNVNAAVNNPIHVMAGGGTEQNTGGNRTWSGSLSGSGPLTVIASATHTWSGNHSGYTGTLTLQGSGALRLSSVNSVSAGTAYNFNGGTMNPNATGVFRLGALSGAAGTLNPSASGSFAIGELNTDTTFGGVIGGSGMIFKLGTGTLTLDGANTFSGATTISNGVLQIGSGGSTGKFGTGVVTNYSRLVFNRGDALVTPNAIHGAGSVTNVGFGKVALTGANTYSGPTTVTAGTLAFGTASLNSGDVTVENAAGLGAVVSSSGATLTQGNATFVTGGSYEFDLGTFGNHPGTVVSNTGTLTLSGNVTVNLAGTNFSTGTITLLRYANRAGGGSFVIGTLPAGVNLVSFNDDTVNKQVTVAISVGVVVDQTFKYVGDTAGVWDIDNLANQIWKIAGTGQITNYTEGAAVLFDDTATGTNSIDLITFVNPSAVTVNNTNKTFTLGGIGSVSGVTGLTKRGPGTLLVTNANIYSGVTAIEAGVIRVEGETGSLGTGGVTNNGVLVLDRTQATNALPNITLFSGQITGTGSLTILGVDSTNSTVQVEVGTTDGNPYSGGTTISNAFVRLNANPSSDATRVAAKSTGLGSGTVTFLGESILELEDYNVANGSAQSGNFATPLHVAAGQSGTLRTAGRATMTSTLTGSGTFNLVVSYVRDVIAGNFSAFAGQIIVARSSSGGDYQVANALGMPLAKLHLTAGVGMGAQGNAGANPVANNAVIPIGELSGDQGASIGAVGDTPRTVTWRVGGLNTSSTFAGNFGAGHGLIKEGSGTLTLSGTNSYTGSTSISNGVLALTADAELTNSSSLRIAAPGSLDVSGRPDGALNVGGIAQSLSGDGTILGRLSVGSLGAVTPGFGVGTLTVTNTVTLGGTATMELNRASAPNSDRIVSPSVVAGGSLVVTNLGVALQAGDTFQLFSTAITGAFASVSLLTNDVVNQVAYTWDNKLAVDGTIVVLTAVPTVNTTPTNITFAATGNTLDLQWPADRIGWTLQTNAVSVDAANQWYPHLGSTLTNRVILTVDPAKTNVFYRLVYP